VWHAGRNDGQSQEPVQKVGAMPGGLFLMAAAGALALE